MDTEKGEDDCFFAFIFVDFYVNVIKIKFRILLLEKGWPCTISPFPIWRTSLM